MLWRIQFKFQFAWGERFFWHYSYSVSKLDFRANNKSHGESPKIFDVWKTVQKCLDPKPNFLVNFSASFVQYLSLFFFSPCDIHWFLEKETSRLAYFAHRCHSYTHVHFGSIILKDSTGNKRDVKINERPHLNYATFGQWAVAIRVVWQLPRPESQDFTKAVQISRGRELHF